MNVPAERRRPHALYIAWGFPPSRGSGVHRALATANGLVEAGFDVTVLTCDRETFLRYTGADTTLEARIHPDIEVVRVPFDWPLMDHDIRRWPRARARDPKGWRDRRIELDQREFPEATYGPWVKRLVAEALRIHRRRPVDLTVATANPNVDVEAARRLQQKAGVPYVADQRDAWTLDTFTEAERGDELIHRVQAEHLRDAAEAWYVNEPIRAWHAARYPDNAAAMKVVMNGFDLDLAPTARTTAPDPARPLTFAYLGTVTSVMPIGPLLDGWVAARAADPEIAAARAELWGYLGFYAGGQESFADLIDGHREHAVDYRGPVPRTAVRSAFDDFDVLLFVVGPGRFITTGKVFDYMASALPIVSVHTPELDASRVLQGYPLWFPASSLEPADIAAALSAGGRAAREATPEIRQACAAYAEGFGRRHQLMPRLHALYDRVTGGVER